MITFIVCLIIFAVSFTWIRKQSKDIKRLEEENEIKDQLIDMMSTEQSLELITTKLVTISDDVSSIKLGVYGDKVNGFKGLIDRQKDDEKRLDDLEEYVPKIKTLEAHVLKSGMTRKKIGLITASGMAAMELLHEAKNYFFK